MKHSTKQWNVQIIFIIAILLSSFAIAANNPGHDTLYIEEQGNSVLNGTLNITQLLTIESNIWIKSYLDLVANGSVLGASPSRNTIVGTNTYLEISTPSGNGLYLNRYGGTIYTGSPSARTDANISGNLYVYNPTGPSTLTVGNVAVCLANGTNCINGANTGNVTSITETGTTPLTISSPTGAVAIGITIPTCTGNDKLTYDGSSFQCSTDIDTNGASNSGGGWTNTTTYTTTNLIVNITNSTNGVVLFVNTSNNNIGIGTPNPTSKLEIYGNADQFEISYGPDLSKYATISMGSSGFLDISPVSGITRIGNQLAQYGNYFALADSGAIGWTIHTNNAYSGVIDLGLARNSSGVLEVNDGTKGNTRDLKVRGLNPTGPNLGIGLSNNATSTLQVNGTTNTTYLTIASATASSCDLKAYTNGTVYCGTDNTGSGADGTGSWTNTTTQTYTTLNVNITRGNLSIFDGGKIILGGTSGGTGSAAAGTHTISHISAGSLYLASEYGTVKFAIGGGGNFQITPGSGFAILSTGTSIQDGGGNIVYLHPDTAAENYVLQLGQDNNGASTSQGIKAADGITGTDISGSNLTIAGGRGTGAGTPGRLIFQTSTALASGTTSHTLATRMIITGTGSIGINTMTPTSNLHVNGTANVTYLTIASATDASCDLKAHTNGTVYCAIDDDAPDDDTEVPNAITLAGGIIGSNTVSTNTAITLTDSISIDSSTLHINGTSDRIGIGTTTPSQLLHVQGNLNVTGVVYQSGADVAENIKSSENLISGEVVIIDDRYEEVVRKSYMAYDPRAAGVVSTNPASVLGGKNGGVPLAITGRVPVKVTNEGGNIVPGDLLTTSSTPGYAMKCKDRKLCSGSIIGKSLGNMKNKKGEVIMLVTLG